MLNTLPGAWDTLHVSLINSSLSGIVTTEYVMIGVLNEEMIRRSQASPSSPLHANSLVIEDRREPT